MIEEHRADYDAYATVVFLGDYVDRGPDSKQVLDLLMAGPTTENTKWICVQGNHEVMLLEALYGGRSEMEFWYKYGGKETLESFQDNIPRKYLTWLAGLPKYHYDGKRVFVHAGTKDNVPLDQTPDSVLQWIRYPEANCEIQCAEGYVVHGHTPYNTGPIILESRCNLDVMSFVTGKAMVAVFDDKIPGKPIELLCSNLGYIVYAG